MMISFPDALRADMQALRDEGLLPQDFVPTYILGVVDNGTLQPGIKLGSNTDPRAYVLWLKPTINAENKTLFVSLTSVVSLND